MVLRAEMPRRADAANRHTLRNERSIYNAIHILNNFRKLSVKAEPLDGKARLALMHGIFHIDGQEQFKFDWKLLAPSGLSVKDFIAPSSFAFSSSRHFRMGAKYGSVSFLNIIAPELNDRLLADFLEMDSSLVTSTTTYSGTPLRSTAGASSTTSGAAHGR